MLYFLYKGLERPWILVSLGFLGANPQGTLRANCMKSSLLLCECVFNVSLKAKERVLGKEKHEMLVEDKLVTIFLKTTENPVENMRPRISSLTHLQAEPQSDQKHPNEEPVPTAVNSSVQKVSFARGAGSVPAAASAVTIPIVLLIQKPHPGVNYEPGTGLGTGTQR